MAGKRAQVLEACRMEIVYFISFVVLCALILRWAFSRSAKNAEKARKRNRVRQKRQAELLSTPTNYVLSRGDEVWRKKREKGAEDVIVTNRFAPKSETAGEPEYDGYSRRDRHHVVVGTAYIKDENHIDEAATAGRQQKRGPAVG